MFDEDEGDEGPRLYNESSEDGKMEAPESGEDEDGAFVEKTVAAGD